MVFLVNELLFSGDYHWAGALKWVQDWGAISGGASWGAAIISCLVWKTLLVSMQPIWGIQEYGHGIVSSAKTALQEAHVVQLNDLSRRPPAPRQSFECL